MVQCRNTRHVCIYLAHDTSRQSQKFDILVRCKSCAKVPDILKNCDEVVSSSSFEQFNFDRQRFNLPGTFCFSLFDRFHIFLPFNDNNQIIICNFDAKNGVISKSQTDFADLFLQKLDVPHRETPFLSVIRLQELLGPRLRVLPLRLSQQVLATVLSPPAY